MVMNLGDVRAGMELLGGCARKIVTVSTVWVDIPEMGVAVIRDKQQDLRANGGERPSSAVPEGLVIEDVRPDGTVAALSEPKASDRQKAGYFLVTGEGDAAYSALYIPFSAIQVLFPGENVTLSCTREECREQYRSRPGFLR